MALVGFLVGPSPKHNQITSRFATALVSAGPKFSTMAKHRVGGQDERGSGLCIPVPMDQIIVGGELPASKVEFGAVVGLPPRITKDVVNNILG